MRSPALCVGFPFQAYCVPSAKRLAVAVNSLMDVRGVGTQIVGASLARLRAELSLETEIARTGHGVLCCIGL